jgi:GNAT superfamily N-acetyltransferase
MAMPPFAGTAWSHVRGQVTTRWEAIDPLLPAPSAPPGCGAELVVKGAGNKPTAIGTCGHWQGRPGSIDLTWGPSRRFRLSPLTAGADVAASLDGLLSQWRDHLASVPEAAEDDTAAIVTWPSRDIEGAATLLRHGLVPLTVIAARVPGAHDSNGAAPADPAVAGSAAGTPLVRIRRAGSADIAAVVSLGMEVVRFDAHFGTVVERPETADALGREAARLLRGQQPWTWLAERDGVPVGIVQAERPDRARWIAPMVRPAPVAYLGQTFVAPGERGRGLGAALAGQAHSEIDAAGVSVTLLHYEQLNPLSGPFWSRRGYRPLWTIWEARPARALS